MAIRYKDDGKLRIIQFTDLHFGAVPSNERDEKTYEQIRKLLEKENPDLVVYSGDIIYSLAEHGAENPKESFEKFIDFLNEMGYPSAITYGNHDTEDQVSREDLRKIVDEKLTCHASKDEIMIKNNRESYIVKILDDSDELKNIIFVLDSGDYPANEYSYYDWIDFDQVSWFREVNQKYGHTSGVKTDLVFQHIPLPEYWQSSENIISGEFKESFAMNLNWLAESEDLDQENGLVEGEVKLKNKELPEFGVCSPELNSGFFVSMLDSKVWGVFVGHDHDNSFDSIYKGIHLVYGQSTGYNSYGNHKGARLIELDQNKDEIKTEILFFED